MRALDLDAEILSGASAAGFEIGMHVTEINQILKKATNLDRLPSVIELRTNSTVLVVREPHNEACSVFFGNDQVRLLFNSESRLFCIFLFEGYRGKYRQKIRIGTQLKQANAEHQLLFDDVDEMNYIDDGMGNIVPGISFIGTCCSLENDPEQLISGSVCMTGPGVKPMVMSSIGGLAPRSSRLPKSTLWVRSGG